MEPKKETWRISYRTAVLLMNGSLGGLLLYVAAHRQWFPQTIPVRVLLAILTAVTLVCYFGPMLSRRHVERGDERAVGNSIRAGAASFSWIMIALIVIFGLGPMLGLRMSMLNLSMVYSFIGAGYWLYTSLFLYYEKKGS